MELTYSYSTYIGIILILLAICIKQSQCVYLCIVMSIFTRMSFVNIGGNSIYIYQVLCLVMFVRVMIHNFQIVSKFGRSLLIFGLYALLSTFLAMLNSDVIVVNVDNIISHVRYGPQQYTQWLYLMLGILFAISIENLINKNKATVEGILWALDVSYVIAVVLGLIQFLMPKEFFDSIFRNGLTGAANQTYGDIYRIASVFSEASMLMMFMTPIMCRYIYEIMNNKNKVKNVVLLLLGGLIVLNNRSGSFVAGMIIFVLFIVFLAIRKTFIQKKLSRKIIRNTFLIGVAVIITLFVFRNQAGLVIIEFLKKINIENTSGIVRSTNYLMHMKAFIKHPIFGIGFGTCRGSDLVSTWLLQMGIVGMALFIIPIAKMVLSLIKSGTYMSIVISISIIVNMVILLISVPEFAHLHLWIYFAMSQKVLRERVKL